MRLIVHYEWLIFNNIFDNFDYFWSFLIVFDVLRQICTNHSHIDCDSPTTSMHIILTPLLFDRSRPLCLSFTLVVHLLFRFCILCRYLLNRWALYLCHAAYAPRSKLLPFLLSFLRLTLLSLVRCFAWFPSVCWVIAFSMPPMMMARLRMKVRKIGQNETIWWKMNKNTQIECRCGVWVQCEGIDILPI